MPKKSVFCVANTREQADRVVFQLKAANFCHDDISVIFLDKEIPHHFVPEKNTPIPEGIVAGVSLGGISGGLFGWMIGIGALSIPVVDAFIVVSPLLEAFREAAMGATVGGLIGGLMGMVIQAIEIKCNKEKTKLNHILISVHTECTDEIFRARKIFTQIGTKDICTNGTYSASFENSKNNSFSNRGKNLVAMQS
ncbi:MAG: DUF3341 domain-containing protein [Verrucomicrobiota bacterium]